MANPPVQDGSQSIATAMQIIPAIDLLGGACVRLHQGDYDQVTRFSDDPLSQAMSWLGVFSGHSDECFSFILMIF